MLIAADTVVTGHRVLRPGWLEIDGDRVVGAGSGRPQRTPDLDLGAVTVVPGFVDIHVHGGGGGAFPEATPEAVHRAVDLHRRHGTTSMVASLVTAYPDELLREVAMLTEQVQDGQVVGIHLEGPWLSPRRCGAHDPGALRDPDPAEIAAVLAAGRGTIRMVTLAPELDGGYDAIRQLVDGGAVAAIGHTNATYEQARAAIDAGARVATHLFNAMRPVHHRDPGPVIALMEDPRVTVEMITDGVHLHPALYRDVAARVGPDRIALVTDAMAATGMPDGDYRLGALAVTVVDGIARLASTDAIAGSTATMADVFRFAVRHSDLAADDALLAASRQASINPARALGLPDPELAPGATADLVVLDEDLAVTGVLRRGDWVVPPPVNTPAQPTG